MSIAAAQKGRNLTGVLDALVADASKDKIKMDKILQSLNRKGFGPLLIAPAMLALLPTGAVPGVPALCGVFIFLISAQILIGFHHPWMPQRLKDVSFRTRKFKAGVKKIRPYTERIDQYVQNRLTVLADNEISKRIVALVVMALGIAMIFVGFIPFFPALLALPVLFFALGLSVHDGVLLAAGYVILFLCLGVMPMMIKG